MGHISGSPHVSQVCPGALGAWSLEVGAWNTLGLGLWSWNLCISNMKYNILLIVSYAIVCVSTIDIMNGLKGSTSNNGSGNCPTEFVDLGGCCYFFSEKRRPTNWAIAKEECEAMVEETGLTTGSIGLAEFGTGAGCSCDTALMEEVRNRGGDDNQYWVGANDLDNEGTWVWSVSGKMFNVQQLVGVGSTRWWQQPQLPHCLDS